MRFKDFINNYAPVLFINEYKNYFIIWLLNNHLYIALLFEYHLIIQTADQENSIWIKPK